jgi:catechol 2,3-dioxygenase-like lactoylglutathione lyase family enzyme
MQFTVDRLDHIVLHVRDVEISATWYQRVLGMEREEFGQDGSRTALRFGGQKINLRPVDACRREWHTAMQPECGTADLCFVTAIGPEEVVGHLHDCGVTIWEGPAPKWGALGPVTSVYCRDPDGNLIEISSYFVR